jgi:hypothetical protein
MILHHRMNGNGETRAGAPAPHTSKSKVETWTD